MINSPNSKLSDYMPALDGLRAIAIISVIIFHLYPPILPGGFTGVDVFFVLSGFLISKIIFKELNDKSFSIKRFFVRRIHRLLPNALLCIIIVSLLANLVTPPSSERYIGEHGLWTLSNFSNIFAWRKLGGYWGAGAESSPLTHFWSLAVEEQFYLVYPFVLILIFAISSKKIVPMLLLGIIISFGCCLFLTYHLGMHIPAFYLLPTRGWQLLIGGLLAAWFVRSDREIRGDSLTQTGNNTIVNIVGLSGLAAIIAGFFCISGQSHYPGVSSLIPTMGAVMTLYAATKQHSLISTMLSERRSVWIGKSSYSLYLWHWPMIVIGVAAAKMLAYPRIYGSLIGCFVGIVLAILAYHFVEQPMRKVVAGNHKRLLAILLMFVLASVICVAGKIGYRKIDPNGHFYSPAWNADLYNSGRCDTGKFSNPNFYDVKFPDKVLPQENTWENEGLVFRYGGSRPHIVVFGSSHALMFGQVIHDICQKHNLSVAFLCMSHGQHPFLDTTPCHNFPTQKEATAFDEKRRELLKKWQPDLLLLMDRWDFREPEEHARRMEQLLMEVTRLSKQVCIVNQIPVLDVSRDNLRAMTAWSIDTELGAPRFYPDSKEERRHAIHSFNHNLISRFPNVKCINPGSQLYQTDGSVKYYDHKTFYYINEDHLSQEGAEIFTSVLENAIVESVIK